MLDGLLLLLEPSIDGFLEQIMLKTDALLQVADGRVELLLIALFPLFGVRGINQNARVNTDFLDFFLKGVNGSLNGWHIEQMLVIKIEILRKLPL